MSPRQPRSPPQARQQLRCCSCALWGGLQLQLQRRICGGHRDGLWGCAFFAANARTSEGFLRAQAVAAGHATCIGIGPMR